MKTCNDCGLEKKLEEFANAGNGKRKSRCTVCNNKLKSQKYYANHVENREKARIKALEFRKVNKGYQRKYDLKRNYGITIEDFDRMLEEQQGRCAICGTTDPSGKHDQFHVDHCHTTGAVRGLLCSGCNVGLGAFKENDEALAKAIDYLKKGGSVV